MSIVAHRTWWFILSGALVAAAVASLAVFGLNVGIDFVGGSIMEVRYDVYAPVLSDVRAELAEGGFGSGQVQQTDAHGLLLRQPVLTEEQHQQVVQALERFGVLDELRFDSIGPVVGEELKRKSFWALALILVAIVAYVAFAFRKASHYVSSWKYGVLTIVAAVHDVVIPLGVFAVLGSLYDVTIGAAFVAALLTVLGYSINDTIVVFDRIRENLIEGGMSFEETVDVSIKQTMARSINTTLTTLLALVAVLVFGGETTREFVLALMIGIGVGAYSSIFLASPLLVVWERRARR